MIYVYRYILWLNFCSTLRSGVKCPLRKGIFSIFLPFTVPVHFPPVYHHYPQTLGNRSSPPPPPHYNRSHKHRFVSFDHGANIRDEYLCSKLSKNIKQNKKTPTYLVPTKTHTHARTRLTYTVLECKLKDR